MKRTGALFFLLACLHGAAPLYAAEGTARDYLAEIGTKFGRGLENILTSPAEIPCTMAADMRETSALSGFFTGFGKGTVFMLRRILAGVTEVGTFVIPMERTIPRVCTEKL